MSIVWKKIDPKEKSKMGKKNKQIFVFQNVQFLGLACSKKKVA